MKPVPRKEIAELMRFVAKKSENAEGPMNARGMCKQFKEETGNALSVRGLLSRIQKNRAWIHKMDEFDMDTRARMMMAVEATVDDDFLRKLSKEAEVKVDDQYRIIRYEKKQRGSDGPSTSLSTSPLTKRRRDSEAGTSEERKRNRTAPEGSDDDEKSKSVGEASSDCEGIDIPPGNDEQLSGPAEIDQKLAELFHNSPDIENNRQEDQDEYNVPENRATEKPATSVGDLRSDGASISSKRKIDSEKDASGRIKMFRTIQIADKLIQNASGVGHRLDDQPPIENDYEEREQDEHLDSKPLIDTQGMDGSGSASGIVVVHDQGNQELIIVEEMRKPSTSVRDLLILLRGLLLSVSSHHLNGLRRKIEEKIQKLSSGGAQLVSLETINLPFDMCLHLLKKHASPKSEGESTSLRRFMTSLQTATCHLVHPSMDPFHEKMKAYLDELDVQDQRIPIKIVHNAMDSVINFIHS